MPAPTYNDIQFMYTNLVSDYARWEKNSAKAKEDMRNIDTLSAREQEDVREFERLTLDEAASLRRTCTRLVTYQSRLDSKQLGEVLDMEKAMKPEAQIPEGYGVAPS